LFAISGDFRNSMWLRRELFYYLLPLICSCVTCPGPAPMRRASRRRAIRKASKTGRRAKGTHLDLQPDALGVGTRLAAIRLREAGIVLNPLLRSAGISADQINKKDIRIGVASQIRFLELAARSSLRPSLLFSACGRRHRDKNC